jgi:hypothetical protein
MLPSGTKLYRDKAVFVLQSMPVPRTLAELYAYYRRTEGMMTNILRDEATMPVLTQMLAGYRQYLAAAREMLLRDRTAEEPARRHVHAVIGHALAFQTWRSLAIEQDLDDHEIAGLMTRLVAAAARESPDAGAQIDLATAG